MRWISAPALALVLCVIAGCAVALPSLEGRATTSQIIDGSNTRLGRAVNARPDAQAGKTGIHPLEDAHAAFAARAMLADSAERSLDVQYYIWHGDQTGYLLFQALWRAAERGVHVRLLLDDNNTAGLDPVIAALDAHPAIEVRLYNPLRYRGLRVFNYATDFTRVNRRMHNKSFIADNQAAIVGGRNVGNEYFAAGGAVSFADLDVIVVGTAVHETSLAFELYWNSASAYPAAALVGPATPAHAGSLQARFAEVRADPLSASYIEALRESPKVNDLLAGQLRLEWSRAWLLHDDPGKTLAAGGELESLLVARLTSEIGRAVRSFDLVSPYFVPGEKFTAALVDMARRGVAVRVLTNSLAASDVSAVHAGYAKWRQALLRAGVKLYELKSLSIEGSAPGTSRSVIGSSSASLHAKTFAIDGQRVFVGSFNFDPRSALLNTEMGLLFDSPLLATELAAVFEREVRRAAYTVRLGADGSSLEWIEETPSGQQRHVSEPEAGVLRRAWVKFLSILPIDWLL